MSMPLEDVTREAIGLPRHQRLALARLLIELDDPGSAASRRQSSLLMLCSAQSSAFGR